MKAIHEASPVVRVALLRSLQKLREKKVDPAAPAPTIAMV
jgi:hypothetical protein